MAFDTDNND